MKVKAFIVSSSMLLAAWLGGTFFRSVPLEQYPLLGATLSPLTQDEEVEKLEIIPQPERALVLAGEIAVR